MIYGSSVTVGTTVERPLLCFMVSIIQLELNLFQCHFQIFQLNGERSEEMKRISMTSCPKTCGYCCQTEPFDCNNSPCKFYFCWITSMLFFPVPRINCAMVTSRMCKDPQWREVLTEDCPNVCGFCLEGAMIFVVFAMVECNVWI